MDPRFLLLGCLSSYVYIHVCTYIKLYAIIKSKFSLQFNETFFLWIYNTKREGIGVINFCPLPPPSKREFVCCSLDPKIRLTYISAMISPFMPSRCLDLKLLISRCLDLKLMISPFMPSRCLDLKLMNSPFKPSRCLDLKLMNSPFKPSSCLDLKLMNSPFKPSWCLNLMLSLLL